MFKDTLLTVHLRKKQNENRKWGNHNCLQEFERERKKEKKTTNNEFERVERCGGRELARTMKKMETSSTKTHFHFNYFIICLWF
jgi:hypothetical protein